METTEHRKCLESGQYSIRRTPHTSAILPVTLAPTPGSAGHRYTPALFECKASFAAKFYHRRQRIDGWLSQRASLKVADLYAHIRPPPLPAY